MRAVDTPTGSFKARHQPLLPTDEEAETPPPRVKPQMQWDCSCPWDLGQATLGQDRMSNSHGRGLEAGKGYGNECLMPEKALPSHDGKILPGYHPTQPVPSLGESRGVGLSPGSSTQAPTLP